MHGIRINSNPARIALLTTALCLAGGGGHGHKPKPN